MLTQGLIDKILCARLDFMRSAGEVSERLIDFYDADRYCAAAPLRDNVLFGRIAFAKAGAADHVLRIARDVLERMDLDREIFRLGLEQPTGPGGRLLFPSQCSAISIARCLVKRPDVFIFNEAAASFGEVAAKLVLDDIRAEMQGRTLIVVTRDPQLAAGFGKVIAFAGARIEAGLAQDDQRPPVLRGTDTLEYRALRAAPIFAEVDRARLRLIAFASERVTFATNQLVFKQGAPSDFVLVVIDGSLDVVLETASGGLVLAQIAAGGILGEMGVLTGAPRSATVIAREEVTALRLSRDVLLGLIEEFPQIARSLLNAQIRRTRDLEKRLAATDPARREKLGSNTMRQAQASERPDGESSNEAGVVIRPSY